MLFFYLFWDVQQDGDKTWGNTIKAAKEIFITVVLMSCYMVGFFLFSKISLWESLPVYVYVFKTPGRISEVRADGTPKNQSIVQMYLETAPTCGNSGIQWFKTKY